MSGNVIKIFVKKKRKIIMSFSYTVFSFKHGGATNL